MSGSHNAIAVDSSGTPHVSYFDATRKDLKYARKEGTVWLNEVVDSDPVGGHTDIAVDSSGNPHISYYDSFNTDLLYATGS